jgi:hypothetical protein
MLIKLLLIYYFYVKYYTAILSVMRYISRGKMPAPQEFDDLTLYLRRTAILRVMRYISRGQDARTTRV